MAVKVTYDFVYGNIGLNRGEAVDEIMEEFYKKLEQSGMPSFGPHSDEDIQGGVIKFRIYNINDCVILNYNKSPRYPVNILGNQRKIRDAVSKLESITGFKHRKVNKLRKVNKK